MKSFDYHNDVPNQRYMSIVQKYQIAIYDSLMKSSAPIFITGIKITSMQMAIYGIAYKKR